MKYFILIITLILAERANADGATSIHGMNALGEQIKIDEESFDYGREGVEFGPNMFSQVVVKKNDKIIRTFEKQLCGHDATRAPTYWTFSCRKNGTSPMAGTLYIYVKTLPDCKGQLFICKEGCRPEAPKELILDPWEC